MNSELLLKFTGYFPDYLSALSRMLAFTLFWTDLHMRSCRIKD